MSAHGVLIAEGAARMVSHPDLDAGPFAQPLWATEPEGAGPLVLHTRACTGEPSGPGPAMAKPAADPVQAGSLPDRAEKAVISTGWAGRVTIRHAGDDVQWCLMCAVPPSDDATVEAESLVRLAWLALARAVGLTILLDRRLTRLETAAGPDGSWDGVPGEQLLEAPTSTLLTVSTSLGAHPCRGPRTLPTTATTLHLAGEVVTDLDPTWVPSSTLAAAAEVLRWLDAEVDRLRERAAAVAATWPAARAAGVALDPAGTAALVLVGEQALRDGGSLTGPRTREGKVAASTLVSAPVLAWRDRCAVLLVRSELVAAVGDFVQAVAPLPTTGAATEQVAQVAQVALAAVLERGADGPTWADLVTAAAHAS